MRIGLRRDLWFTSVLIVFSLLSLPVLAESVTVKDRGNVDLTRFKCQDKTRSNFITRVCYDAGNRYMLIRFEDGTYRQYCRVDVDTANGLVSAPSIGKFYNIRIRGTDGPSPHDCLTHKTPSN